MFQINISKISFFPRFAGENEKIHFLYGLCFPRRRQRICHFIGNFLNKIAPKRIAFGRATYDILSCSEWRTHGTPVQTALPVPDCAETS